MNLLGAFQDDSSLKLPKNILFFHAIHMVRGESLTQDVSLELSYAQTIHKFQRYQAGRTCDVTNIVCNQATGQNLNLSSQGHFIPHYPGLRFMDRPLKIYRKLRKNKTLFLRHAHVLNR